MNHVKTFDLFGVKVRQIPCIPGTGAPTPATEGAVGCLYMDTNTGDLYKCIAVADGVYTWSGAGNGESPESVLNAVTYTPQTLAEDQQAQARANIGAVTLQDVLDALPVYDGSSIPSDGENAGEWM